MGDCLDSALRTNLGKINAAGTSENDYFASSMAVEQSVDFPASRYPAPIGLRHDFLQAAGGSIVGLIPDWMMD